jgi:hypothetical protein
MRPMWRRHHTSGSDVAKRALLLVFVNLSDEDDDEEGEGEGDVSVDSFLGRGG